MAKHFISKKTGTKVILLNPAERSKRYARELRHNRKQDGSPLSDVEAGFRMGVLNERATQAKIYNKKHGRKGKKNK